MEQRRQGKHVPCKSFSLTGGFFALPEVGDLLCLGQRASIFEQLKLNIPLTPALLTKIIEIVWQLTFSSSQNLSPAPAAKNWVNLFFLVFLTIF
jgi:hypothetical protein